MKNRMKKIFLTALGLCLSVGLFAQTEGMAVLLNKKVAGLSANNKISWQSRLMWRIPVSSELKQERGLWDITWGWISGSQEEKETEALAGYLFNMYVFSAAQGYVPQKLDLNFTGVLDPLENIEGGYETKEIRDLYFDEKEKVKNYLARLFKNKLGLVYHLQNKQNDQREEEFLRVLANSSFSSKKAHYVKGNTPFARQEAEEVKKALQTSFANCMDGASICTYEQIDVFDMMDRKSGTARKDYYYRPASQECDACAYTFCKTACLRPQQDYAGWKMDALYRIYARPVQKEFLTPSSGTHFLSVNGQKYAPWNYHAAALFRLKKEGQYTLMVQDTFLFKDPVPLAVWAEKFAEAQTYFDALPFQRKERTEKQFIRLPADQMDALRQGKSVKVNGITYAPYPVYEAE